MEFLTQYWPLIAAFIYMNVEFFLGKTKIIKSGSVLELILRTILKVISAVTPTVK